MVVILFGLVICIAVMIILLKSSSNLFIFELIEKVFGENHVKK